MSYLPEVHLFSAKMTKIDYVRPTRPSVDTTTMDSSHIPGSKTHSIRLTLTTAQHPCTLPRRSRQTFRLSILLITSLKATSIMIYPC